MATCISWQGTAASKEAWESQAFASICPQRVLPCLLPPSSSRWLDACLTSYLGPGRARWPLLLHSTHFLSSVFLAWWRPQEKNKLRFTFCDPCDSFCVLWTFEEESRSPPHPAATPCPLGSQLILLFCSFKAVLIQTWLNHQPGREGVFWEPWGLCPWKNNHRRVFVGGLYHGLIWVD